MNANRHRSQDGHKQGRPVGAPGGTPGRAAGLPTCATPAQAADSVSRLGSEFNALRLTQPRSGAAAASAEKVGKKDESLANGGLVFMMIR